MAGWDFAYQNHPGVSPSECVIHIILKDTEAGLQRKAIGIIGVNLMHACLYDHYHSTQIIDSLRDNLSKERVEVDMIRVAGPAFAGIDNRALALRLVKNGLAKATMFDPQGKSASTLRSPIQKKTS